MTGHPPAPRTPAAATSTTLAAKPLIGLPACIRTIEHMPFHTVGDKYLRAAAVAAHGIPMIIPSFGDLLDPADLVSRLDGLLLTGSPSNVHPAHYGAPAHPEAEPHDPDRDATTLPLIHAALADGLPLLAICRGMQELNVALGGTLHARVHEQTGRIDHRRPSHEDMDVQYAPRHEVRLTTGGAMARIAGPVAQSGALMVNSLHWQAIDRVADDLVVEAVAPDGTIEAVAVRSARAFALGVQWHPEYRVLDDPFSVRLFADFGAAARARAANRGMPVATGPGTGVAAGAGWVGIAT
ncbi:MAG TPA: gamma-glutamyl-gamma-aminobutyrate hydrolase family protein [Kiloniellales bacterium]|jgi:putative glutamine amidotransferase